MQAMVWIWVKALLLMVALVAVIFAMRFLHRQPEVTQRKVSWCKTGVERVEFPSGEILQRFSNQWIAQHSGTRLPAGQAESWLFDFCNLPAIPFPERLNRNIAKGQPVVTIRFVNGDIVTVTRASNFFYKADTFFGPVASWNPSLNRLRELLTRGGASP